MTVSNIYLVIDESGSMDHLRLEADRVVHTWLEGVGRSAAANGQEALVTVVTFADSPRVVASSVLPSVASAGFRGIRPFGMTALRDALGLAVTSAATDLHRTGADASALVVAITDGGENVSTKFSAYRLHTEVTGLLATGRADVGVLVPRGDRDRTAHTLGISPHSVREWEVNAAGLVRAQEEVNRGMSAYFRARSAGKSAVGSFFVDADRLDPTALASLVAIPAPRRWTVSHRDSTAIKEFLEAKTGGYILGTAYYELTKAEKLQPQKQMIVHDVQRDLWYQGPHARRLLGLPEEGEIRIRPGDVTKHRVFVQSTSVNRKLVPGTDVVLR